jgi:hypothetical protein
MTDPNQTEAGSPSSGVPSGRGGRLRLLVGRALRAEATLFLAILAVQLILVAPHLMPTYGEINAFDEAKYIESGRLLLLGELRNLSWGPIVALAYAPFHLLWGSSPDWFTLEARAGQFLLFGGMWLATVYLAHKLRGRSLALVTAGLLFVSTAFFGVLNNPSDAALVIFSALALAKAVGFFQDRSASDAWQASLFVGLGVLARVEAILYLPLLVALVLGFGRRRQTWIQGLGRSVLPAMLVLATYLVLSGSVGASQLGIGSKAYDSFEVNQPIPGGGSNEAQRRLARELFGTSEENQGSILRAISRNPGAFLSRPWINAQEEPARYLDAFGARLGPALLMLAVWGLIGLILRRDTRQALALVLWAAPPLVSLFFLPLHFIRQVSFLILILAAFGVHWVTQPASGSRTTLLGISILMGLAGWLSAKLGFAVSGLVLAAGLLFIELGAAASVSNAATRSTGLLILLAGGLVLRPSYRFPDFPPLGDSAREQAVHLLQETVPEGGRVLEPLPLPAVAAKLVEVSPDQVPSEIQSAESLRRWLDERDIRAIYSEGGAGYPDHIWALVQAGAGSLWNERYTQGNVTVYLLP